MLKRIVYLGYYLKQLDTKSFRCFFDHVKTQQGCNAVFLMCDIAYSSLRYNISLLEYFQFGFYAKSRKERSTWAGTGTMYEYQRIMNPPDQRGILDDKREFAKTYRDFMLHQTATYDEIRKDAAIAERLLCNPSGRIVFKVSNGKCGRQVEIETTDKFTATSLPGFMEENGYDLVEAFVQQHGELNRLSPSGVNTVRIITQLDADDAVHILGCRQRISIDSPIDNMAAGNIAAAIDEKTGIICGKGFYSDMTKPPVETHPMTGVPLVGFQVPYWTEIMALVKSAALVNTRNRSIGWDVVVTDLGPGLIEGNHDWCKLVWQLPVQKGLKPVLDGYLAEYRRTTNRRLFNTNGREGCLNH